MCVHDIGNNEKSAQIYFKCCLIVCLFFFPFFWKMNNSETKEEKEQNKLIWVVFGRNTIKNIEKII